jgi:hypothetical protein
MKRFIGVALALVLLAIVVLFAAIDPLVKAAVERGASHATGVSTRVQSLDLALLAGQLDMRDLVVANPSGGYESPYFFQLDSLVLAVKPTSLLQPTVNIPRFVIDGAQLNLERAGGKANFTAILDHIKQLGGTGEAKPAPKAEKGKRFIIGDLELKGISAHVVLAKELKGRGQVRTTLPTIRLHDVGSKSGGVTLQQLATLIVQNLLDAVKKSGVLPAELQQQLTRSLEQIRNLRGTISEQTERAKEKVEERAKGAVEQEKKKLLEKGKQLLQGR